MKEEFYDRNCVYYLYSKLYIQFYNYCEKICISLFFNLINIFLCVHDTYARGILQCYTAVGSIRLEVEFSSPFTSSNIQSPAVLRSSLSHPSKISGGCFLRSHLLLWLTFFSFFFSFIISLLLLLLFGHHSIPPSSLISSSSFFSMHHIQEKERERVRRLCLFL